MGDQMAVSLRKAEANKKAIVDTLGVSDLDLQEIMSNPEAFASMLEGKELTEDQIANLEEYLNSLYEEVNTMRE